MKITEIKAIASAAPVPDMRGDRRNYVYVKVSTDAPRAYRSPVEPWG